MEKKINLKISNFEYTKEKSFFEENNLFTIGYAEKAWRLRNNAGITPLFLNKINQRPTALCPICHHNNADKYHLIVECSFAKHVICFISKLLEELNDETTPELALLEGMKKCKDQRKSLVADLIVISLATIQDQIYSAYNLSPYDGKRLLCKRIFMFRRQEKQWYTSNNNIKFFLYRWSKSLDILKTLYE